MLQRIFIPLCDEPAHIDSGNMMLPWILGGVCALGAALLFYFIRRKKK